MGKRSKIIKAIKANPKEFMWKAPWGFEPLSVTWDKDGKPRGCTALFDAHNYRPLVRSILRQLGYMPKKRVRG